MDIEKEVKKMTLGHEFGAGALCLKCKDKCEGFELHFWRKICRNCKCGLTEHDVQMESEEDKKVGKLFEDTKYTGLIAKLKRDGIPGQQSKMSMTISVPASSMAHIVPPSLGTSSLVPPSQLHPNASPSSSGYSSVSSSTGSIPGAVAGTGSGAGSGPGFGSTGGPGSVGGSQPGFGSSGGPGTTAGSRPGFGSPGGPGSVGGSQPGFGSSGGPGSIGGSGPGFGSAGGPGSTSGSGPGFGSTGGRGPSFGSSGGPGSAAGSGPGFGSTGRPGSTGGPGLGPGGVSVNLTPVKASAMPVSVSSSSSSVEQVPKDTPMKSVTFEWAPPVANKHVAIRYIELLPPERRPIAGTPGAAYRRQQMAKQLPEHDQDPNKCHDLSPAEVKQMQQYVRKYKDEALGVGDVCLPQEVAQAAGRGELGGGVGPGGAGAGAGSGPGSGPGSGEGLGGGSVGTAAAAGAIGAGGQQNFTCHQCRGPMRVGDPAVYAERAGYDKMWHPACFVCVTCQELLVDMIYFWKKGKMFCGRHYGDSEKPRCAGCDELIFSNEYTQAEGHDWHLKHFCCFECDCVLAGETYVMEEEKPVCKPCYMKNYAMKCSSCQSPIEPEAQRVSYGAHCWHAQPECFQCSGCSQCLMGKRFMAVQNHLFCSVECKKKIIT
ncbi:testin [Periophthalmus magnuspinnatus]|uniref:testin n=1 Tax=Periophthalmus magnuspinnatus TaxID=409849 RepID=UPI00145C139B|nr:testin [Periophthalmus magnuspinnatus]